MNELEINKVEELKGYLLKSNSHFGGSKFYHLTKELTEEEKIALFSDPSVLKRIYKLEDYDTVASVFRIVPAEIQDLMWENVPTQKILLGMGKVTDEELMQLVKNKKFFSMQELEKRNKNGRFYYNPNKLRALQVLLRQIKSVNIQSGLPYNKYFQIILLCSKKVPESFYTLIDVETTFNQIVNSDVYKMGDVKSRELWVQQINNNFPRLLLPHDYKTIFAPTTKFKTWFYGDEKTTLGGMIHSKLYALSKKGFSLEIDMDTLSKLNLQEINVLKSDENGVVDQEFVNQILAKVIDKAIEDGTVFSNQYLDVNNLDVKVQRALFKIVIERCIGNPLYEDKLLEYLYGLLFREEYNELEKNALKISLKNALVYADEDTVGNLFKNSNDLKSLFYLRFNLTAANMNYLYGISVGQLMRINVKHINRIVKLIFDPENDELSDSYSKAIKLYIVFGLERTLELLSGRYAVNKTFFDNVSKLNVSKIEMKLEGKKYLPVTHEEFSRFVFNSHNINALFDEDAAISTSWYYLFNNFDSIKDLCKGHVTLSQAETILKEQVNTVKYDLDPDCYRLEKVLHEAGLGNKGHTTNEAIYDEMCVIHKKQVRRVASTIPYVKGKLANGWGYEVMRHDAAIAYVLGYRADCCIRTKDIAHNHLLHALLCESGRILLTYKPDGTIASFSPLKRNGELLIANSIEAIDKNDGVIAPMVEAFETGMKEICRVSKATEEKNYLKVATIGSGSLRKPAGESWPETIPTPTILEKDDPIYGGTDSYHHKLVVFYKDTNNLSGLKYGKTEQKYYDERRPILACTWDRENVILQRKVLTRINSVRFTKWIDEGNSKESFEPTRMSYYRAAFCNDDWYVIVDYYGIHSGCLDDDPRAKKEMNAVIATINEYAERKEDIKGYVMTMNKKA